MGGGTSGGRAHYATTRSSTQSNYTSTLKTRTESTALPNRRVFISFHMENELQVDLLRHQAKSDRFDLEFTDYSVKEPFDERWKSQCTEKIRNSSVFIVMIGHETYSRPAVLWEINKAYELGKPVIGVRIHRNARDPIPEPLLRHGSKVVNWNMEEIQDAIDEA